MKEPTITIRLPENKARLRDDLKATADRLGLSMNRVAVFAIEDFVKAMRRPKASVRFMLTGRRLS